MPVARVKATVSSLSMMVSTVGSIVRVAVLVPVPGVSELPALTVLIETGVVVPGIRAMF